MSAPPVQGVAGVYRHIIDDVVTRVRTEFVQEGVDEGVLDELRELWETKLDESGAIAVPPPVQVRPPGPAPQYYQPVQSAAYSAPSASFDPSKLGKPEQLQPTGFLPAARPLAHPGAPQQLQRPANAVYAAAAPAGYAAASAPGGYAVARVTPGGMGMPAVSAAPAAYAMQASASRPAASAAPGGYAMPGASTLQPQHVPQQQRYAPQQPPQQQLTGQQMPPQQPVQQPAQQQYRPVAQPPQQFAPAVEPVQLQQPAQQQQLQQPAQQPPVPQQHQQQQQAAAQDAAAAVHADTRKRAFEDPDQSLQGGPAKQPYQQPNGAVAAPATAAAATIPQRDGNDDDGGAGPSGAGGAGDDAFAGSDEGDDPLAGLSSDEDGDGDNIPNVVLAQFEKVARTKTRAGTKWKCQLKNGIMHLNGRDIIFHKCNGEMQF